MICRCYRCERRIDGAGKWVKVSVGRVPVDVFVCFECARVMAQ